MSWIGSEPLRVVWDLLRDAAVVGWLATALFCAVTGVAVALWAGVRWWAGLLLGAVALYAGLLLLLLVGGVRTAERARAAHVTRRATADGWVAPAAAPPFSLPPGAPAVPAPVAPTAPATRTAPAGTPAVGLRAGVRRGWRWWTRTPPTRADVAVAVLAVVLAAGLFVALGLTWVKLSAVGYGVAGLGPFEIQLGLFVVLSALAVLVCAVGVLRWRSAWWPVLLAWFGAWWLFVTVEVLRAEGALVALNRLVRDQVRDRLGYDARPQLSLGTGWSVMTALATAMMVLAVVLLVLQGRRGPHYRLDARP